ncbi:unnamed protein product [Rodentolepis nana]|uniref:Dishevelled n=1 Tax=Rodentolepis nana TaxID=102285 RepID=A0A158QGZ6_RODNA|nr:unnamed protein product [Rodentolepis nana]
MDDTKIIYHIDDENTPYLVKLSVKADKVTLGDFKAALNRPNYKFFFKSVDADFGVVKEEISDDTASLPCFNGRVIAWLVTADGSAKSDNRSSSGDVLVTNFGEFIEDSGKTSNLNRDDVPNVDRDECDTCGDSESACSGDHLPPLQNFHNYKQGYAIPVFNLGLQCGYVVGSRLGKIGGGRGNQSIYDTSSSMLSSDLESTSFFDSEDESSRFSTATGTTMSSMRYGAHRHRRRRRFMPINRISEDASSYSSMTDSTMSLNIVTVTLKMDTVNYLGISIVGQSNRAGDGGIYVGSIMRGGAVALDGRIEPGDMLLEVNGISFEDMSNDDAVRVLREQVQKPGPITLVVAKCWDPNPRPGGLVLSRQEPVRPIDPRAWVLHTNAMTAAGGVANVSSIPSSNLAADGMAGISDVTSTAFSGSKFQKRSCRTKLKPFYGYLQGILCDCLLFVIIQDLKLKIVIHPSFCFNLSAYPSMQSGGITNGSKSMLPLSNSNASGSSVTAKSGPESTVTVGNGTIAPPLTSHLPSSNQAPSEMISEKPQQLSITTDMALVVRAMLLPDSGLEIHDRTWLKITISNAVIGKFFCSELVDWLFAHVNGFMDRREVRKYASNMLKCGYIRHTVNKNNFSEQCYYVFSELAGISLLNLEEMDSVSEIGGASSGTHQIMSMKNGVTSAAAAGSSLISSAYVRSLPPTGFSAVSAATVTTAPPGTSHFWQSNQTIPMFPANSQQGSPLPLPPPPINATGHPMTKVILPDLQTPDVMGLQQQQQRQNVAVMEEDERGSTGGSSSSTSSSSTSSTCSSTARRPPPPLPQQSYSVDTMAPSVHSVSVTPCSCINLRRSRRRNLSKHPNSQQVPPVSSIQSRVTQDNHSATTSAVIHRFTGFPEEPATPSFSAPSISGLTTGVIHPDSRGACLLNFGQDTPPLSRGPSALPPTSNQTIATVAPQLPSCAVPAVSQSDQ